MDTAIFKKQWKKLMLIAVSDKKQWKKLILIAVSDTALTTLICNICLILKPWRWLSPFRDEETRVACKSIDLIYENLEYNLCYPKPSFLSTKPYCLSNHADYFLVLNLSYHWEILGGLMSSSSLKWTLDLRCLGILLFKFHCIDSQWLWVYIVRGYYECHLM